MKRAAILLTLLAVSAPLFAQEANEVGAIVSGSRRFVKTGAEDSSQRLDSTFSFSNTAFDIYWATALDPDTWFRINVGRIETPIAVRSNPGQTPAERTDVDGELEHVDAIVEYRFEEPYGSTGLFGGVGLYRQSAQGVDSKNDFGFNFGVDADFPMTTRTGVRLQAAYYWPRGQEFQPRYLTVGAGLRVGF